MGRSRRSKSRTPRRRRGGLGSLGVPLCPCTRQQLAGLGTLGAGGEGDPYGYTGRDDPGARYRPTIESPSGAGIRLPASMETYGRKRENTLLNDLVFFGVIAGAGVGAYFLYKHFKKPTPKAVYNAPLPNAPLLPEAGPPEPQAWTPSYDTSASRSTDFVTE